MIFLAENKIVHRDLAARNILLDEKKIAKISDFGLSRDLIEENSSHSGQKNNLLYYRNRNQIMFPLLWTAPEFVKEGIFDLKSDVWSFGEIFKF